MSFTPGPWRVSGDYGNKDQHPSLTIESDFGQITKVLSENCDVDEQVIADAKLIAAAPKMFSALDYVLCWMTNANVIEPHQLAAKVIEALKDAGMDVERLDDAAIAMMRGAAAPFADETRDDDDAWPNDT